MEPRLWSCLDTHRGPVLANSAQYALWSLHEQPTPPML